MAYSSHDTERWAAEPPKRAGRTHFQRDRARVLHSSALRRLAAKTQVVQVGASDFPRTRLTHSLECAQIGRELGAALGCDPDLVDAACLAHDLGHPPFGHNGETALASLAADGGPLACGGFEGNAQSLRLLTRLEPKVPGAGLNLTRATLDAALKYPFVGSGTGKYGAYRADAVVFDWIRAGAPPGRPCLEAQVMDWADDVAYSVHDVEDGLHAGLVTVKNLRDSTERKVVALVALTSYCSSSWNVTAAELETVFAEFMELSCWRFTFDGGPAALAAAKNLTSELVGRFCQAAERATLAAVADPVHATGPSSPSSPSSLNSPSSPNDPSDPASFPSLTRYAADLVVPRRQLLECALLKAVAAHYVMTREGAAVQQARERELIAELALAIDRGAPSTLDPVFRPAWDDAAGDESRRRVIIDQVASLTDTSAMVCHRRLVLNLLFRGTTPRKRGDSREARMTTFVIVGGGLAGAKAAETLRAEGFDGEIVLLGDEPELPYERPPLSKGYLLGKAARESAIVYPAGWYAENNVDLRTGVTVGAIDPGAHTVSFRGEDPPGPPAHGGAARPPIPPGGTLTYDKLLLVPGASPRRINIPGATLDGVLYLRTLPDSDRLREAFTAGRRVVIVGAGWIGLETAAAANMAGCQVTVIEPQPSPLYAALGPELGEAFAELHRSHGVEFRFGDAAAEFHGDAAGRVGSVLTAKGEVLPANVVVVAIGVAPNVGLATSAGLEVSNGVVTDAALRTSDPDIYAAGDVANSFNPLLGRLVRVEHWANALHGGPAAARSMLGQPVTYDRVPYFYSDQYDLGMECSGLPEPGTYDEVVYRGDRPGLEFIAFWLSAGKLVAGMNVNVWDVTDDIQSLIRSARTLDPSRLADPTVPLAEI